MKSQRGAEVPGWLGLTCPVAEQKLREAGGCGGRKIFLHLNSINCRIRLAAQKGHATDGGEGDYSRFHQLNL